MADLQELRAAEHQARCDLIDALNWLDVWVRHGHETDTERRVVAQFVDELRSKYPQQKARRE